MDRELIINVTPQGTDLALLEDKRLVELHKESGSNQYLVGDIFLGRVNKVVPGLNAAFVDVGYQKDAFLHYTDLGPNFRSLAKFTRMAISGNVSDPLLPDFKLLPEIDKYGNVKDVLKSRQPILVQIMKEPISTKGPRLSCELSIAGRFLVLTPFNDVIGVSRKIPTEEERKRLQRLISTMKPKNFGVVIRTAAQNQTAEVLHKDLERLLHRWRMLVKNLAGAVPPKKVLGEMDKTLTILRDLLNETFNRIVTNDPVLASDIESYLKTISPKIKKDLVQIYRGNKPIFDHYGITRQIKSLFGRTVTLPGGAYLVIEHTEALHVIDVNSGQKISTNADQESVALAVNMEAAEEIARQLRLRDLGGIIVVDFIDMKKPEHKKAVYQKMKEAMQNDRAKHKVLPLSRIGLMQITRQRVRPELNITTTEVCPTCMGTGQIEASILLVDQIELQLSYLAGIGKKFHLVVHPFVEAYLKRGFPSRQLRWFWKYKKWIPIEANNDFPLIKFAFYDENGEEISTSEK